MRNIFPFSNACAQARHKSNIAHGSVHVNQVMKDGQCIGYILSDWYSYDATVATFQDGVRTYHEPSIVI